MVVVRFMAALFTALLVFVFVAAVLGYFVDHRLRGVAPRQVQPFVSLACLLVSATIAAASGWTTFKRK